jgi:hypothetical protein
MNISEGTVLEVKEHPDGILLQPLSGIKAGKVIGQREYNKIIGQSDRLRSEWR